MNAKTKKTLLIAAIAGLVVAAAVYFRRRSAQAAAPADPAQPQPSAGNRLKDLFKKPAEQMPEGTKHRLLVLSFSDAPAAVGGSASPDQKWAGRTLVYMERGANNLRAGDKVAITGSPQGYYDGWHTVVPWIGTRGLGNIDRFCIMKPWRKLDGSSRSAYVNY